MNRREVFGGGLAALGLELSMTGMRVADAMRWITPVMVGPLPGSPVSQFASRLVAQSADLSSTQVFLEVEGFAEPEDGGRARYRRAPRPPAHPGWFRSADGSVWEIASPVLVPQMFGVVGMADDFDVFSDWAAAARALVQDWRIPPGEYVLNGNAPLVLSTSGTCEGVLLIPKANAGCRVAFEREAPGSKVEISGWSAMARGSTALNARNAAGMNLYIGSVEILVGRPGPGAYYKQEFVRCRSDGGDLTTPLVCTYDDPGKVEVTAHQPSEAIVVRGLKVRRTGAGPATLNTRGSILVSRDNVLLEDVSITNDDPRQPLAVAMEVSFCADVTLARPYIRGVNASEGLGYGVLFGTTIGCTVRDPDIRDCREAISGRHNVDLKVLGGVCSPVIDDHWGDRMLVRDTTVECRQGWSAIQYAGNDITLENLTVRNGRGVLAIRSDTPHLGGQVVVRNVDVRSRGEVGGAYYLVAMSTPAAAADPGGPGRLSLPDAITLEGGVLDVEIEATYMAYLGVVEAPHRNWGAVSILGGWDVRVSGDLYGVFLYKDARRQRDRATRITVEAPIAFGGGPAVFVSALDDTPERGAIVTVSNIAGGNLRYSPYGVASMTVSGGSVGAVDNDDPSEPAGASRSVFTSVRMTGGGVGAAFRNIAFVDCAFLGDYEAFPPAEAVSLRGSRGLAGRVPAANLAAAR